MNYLTDAGVHQFLMQASLLVVLGLKLLVHVLVAVAVRWDAAVFERENGKTVLIGPRTWVLATLVGGLLAGVAYWVLHHSTLRRVGPAVEAGAT